jgi:hypothetical protein
MAPPVGLEPLGCTDGEGGFSLLEGLAAIALLAGTMVAIFALVGSILDSAYRVGTSNASVQISLNALEVMNAVNPMLNGTGKVDLGPYSVSWTSTPATPVVDRAGSLYQLGLYNSDIRVEERSGSILARMTLRQVGYQLVREPGPSLAGQGILPGISPTR